MNRPIWLTVASCTAFAIASASMGCGSSSLGNGGAGAAGRGGMSGTAGGPGGTTGVGGGPAGEGGSATDPRCHGGAPCESNEICQGACGANGSRVECFCQTNGFLCWEVACSAPTSIPICPIAAPVSACDPQVDTVCHTGWCSGVTGADATCVCAPISNHLPGTGGAGGAAGGGTGGEGFAASGSGYQWACGSFPCPSGAGGGGALDPVVSPPTCRAGISSDDPCDWRTDGFCETACSTTTHMNQDCVCAAIVGNNTYWQCAPPKSCVP